MWRGGLSEQLSDPKEVRRVGQDPLEGSTRPLLGGPARDAMAGDLRITATVSMSWAAREPKVSTAVSDSEAAVCRRFRCTDHAFRSLKRDKRTRNASKRLEFELKSWDLAKCHGLWALNAHRLECVRGI